jgi:hypothetical protein
VEIFPASAALVALPGAIAGDAMADAVDAAEFLDIEVDELARFLTFISSDSGISGLASSALGRPRPRRRSTAPTVERGTFRRSAIAGPVMR